MLSGPSLLPKIGRAERAVILIHGYGDSGEGLIDIGFVWQQTMPGTAFFAPDAPSKCEVWDRGYQWFPIRNTEGIVTKDMSRADLVKNPARQLNAYIDHVLQEHKIEEKNLAVMGFSQGAMMAMYAMPRRQKPCASVAAYSGMLIDADGLNNKDIVKMPVLIVHGDQDDVVVPSSLTEAEQGLSGAGFKVETVLRPGLGHSIDNFGLDRGAAFIMENFAR